MGVDPDTCLWEHEHARGPHRTNGRERRNGAAETAEGNPVARGLLADAAATGPEPRSADRSQCHAKGTPVRDLLTAVYGTTENGARGPPFSYFFSFSSTACTPRHGRHG